MSHFFTTELGRMRTQEAIARADRYRLAQQAQQHKERTTLSHTRRFAYRRALAAVGLSALVAIGTATAALAYPAGPGPNTGSDIVADQTHPQVKGVSIGIPVDAEVADTFVQAREGTAPDVGGGLDTFVQAREGTAADLEGGLPTFAHAREGAPQPVVAAVPSEGERFVASGLYADRATYVALGSRHNTDALDRMTGAPTEVADTGVRPEVDSGMSMTSVLAIAALLVLVGGGVMVAIRDRDLPKPI